MTRIAITYVLRGDLLSQVEAFRVEHDWLASSIPAHLSLIPPFQPTEPKETRAVLSELIKEIAPIEMSTGRPDQEPERIFLPVADGHAALASVRSKFLSACGHQFDPLPALGITVARPRDDREAEKVLTLAKAALQPIRLTLTDLAILEERDDGSWRPQ